MKDIPATDMPDFMGSLAQLLVDAPLDDAMKECVGILQEGFIDNWNQTADSEGTPWPLRKDPRPTHPLLQLTGALLASTQAGFPGNVTIIENRSVVTGIDKSIRLGGIPGAAVHQFGYPPRNIAQREYMYAGDSVLEECAEIVADEVLEKLLS